MKFYSFLLVAVVSILITKTYASHSYDSKRADSHGPIMVMGDHTHKTGEIMLSYRYMQMHMSNLKSGSDSITMNELFSQGYSIFSNDMDMQMHMIGAMYAPSENLTLMGMLMYTQKTMNTTMKMHPMGNIEDSMHMAELMKHSMAAEGLGDLSLSLLYHIADLGYARIHLNLGLSIPSGSQDKENNGMFLAYPMQLGSGTWDILPGITYTAQRKDLSWGAQLGAKLRTGNEDNYSLSHFGQIQAWVAKSWIPSLSTSLKINNEFWGPTNGEDLRLSMAKMKNPLADGALQGGFRSELGLGINYYHQSGTFAGQRIALEFTFPILEDFDGIQMARDFSFILGWQYAF